MNTKILVVNADDLGFSADINSAIEEGHRAGHITNASLMIDGKDLDGALSVIRRNPKLGIGLHLDLCPVVGLYNLPYEKMREGLLSAEMKRKVADEVERQIKCFKGLGIEFTHLDGHRHFHALPEVFHVVVEVAARNGLRTIRLTKDWILPRTPSVYWDDAFFRSALDLLRQRRIMYPDKFIYGWKAYSAASFEAGVNELMVHVGYNEASYAEELHRLSSDELWRNIRDQDFQLRSYWDLAAYAHPR